MELIFFADFHCIDHRFDCIRTAIAIVRVFGANFIDWFCIDTTPWISYASASCRTKRCRWVFEAVWTKGTATNKMIRINLSAKWSRLSLTWLAYVGPWVCQSQALDDIAIDYFSDFVRRPDNVAYTVQHAALYCRKCSATNSTPTICDCINLDLAIVERNGTIECNVILIAQMTTWYS